jgi:hypothetical protein
MPGRRQPEMPAPSFVVWELVLLLTRRSTVPLPAYSHYSAKFPVCVAAYGRSYTTQLVVRTAPTKMIVNALAGSRLALYAVASVSVRDASK